ncbi:MAG: YlmC/YmxH family sporulation protein [Oscillospiraceae bacterium]|nr:YlmC/YmxH family sporulation protein [Oscillospiraceae bacterium]
MFHGCSLRQRIVINTDTAERIGCVADIEIDNTEGRITKLIVRRRAGLLFGLLHIGEVSVPWESITAIGREFILVKITELTV